MLYQMPRDDGRMLGEVGLGIDETGNGNDLGDFSKLTDFRFDDREAGDEGESCGFLCLFERAFGRDFAEEFLITDDRKSAGEMEEVSGANDVQIRAHWSGCFREFITERGELFFRSHRKEILVWCVGW